MKKILLFILCAVLCIGAIAVVAEDSETKIELKINDPVMTVNDTQKEIDPGMGTTPVIVNDRTLLPVRAVVEELGGSVDWDGDTREVTLKCGEDEIRLTIDSLTAYLNGEAQTLDTTPVIMNERTMLPIRFIAEGFGFDVEWDGNNQLVTITKPAKAAETDEPTETPAATEATTAPTAEVTKAPSDNQAEESKTLVAYFSNTGNTEAIANHIIAALGADVYEIEAVQPYTSEDLNYNTDCRANREQNDDSARPEIGNLPESIDEYDTIYIGYPIWWGQAPKIIYTFLESYDFSGKTIIPFCTSGSSSIGTSDDNLHASADGANWIDGRRFSGSAAESEVENWVNGISK